MGWPVVLGYDNGSETTTKTGSENLASDAPSLITLEELELITGRLSENASFAVRLAALTGIGRKELVWLQWSQILEFHIELPRLHGGSDERTIVPLLPDARALLDALKSGAATERGRRSLPSPFILRTSRGGPWTPDTLDKAFTRAATALGIVKRFEHLRGTAVARMSIAGASIEDIASVSGWSRSEILEARILFEKSKCQLGEK